MEVIRVAEESVIEKLKNIYDPEIPVDIYNLGLIYKIDVKESNNVFITMTLTTATCPAAAYMPQEVETALKEIPGVQGVLVQIVWQPKWNRSMMSKDARRELGF
jgi:FeS assembly SUF system protein